MQAPSFSQSVPVVTAHVALLIDGDNISHSEFGTLVEAAKAMGRVVATHVFCDVSKRPEWSREKACTTTHAPSGQGKNRADLHLAVAALDLAHRGLAESFLIASDDQDFLPLVAALKLLGLRVEVRGKPTPTPSVEKTDPALVPTYAALVPKIVVRPSVPKLSAIDQSLIAAIKKASPDNKGVSMKQIGENMKGDPVKVQTGMATWRSYLAQSDHFMLVGKGSATLVRFVTP